MKKVTRWLYTITISTLLCTNLLSAEELRYNPINPSFGGSPLNGSYLLGSATAQRQYDAPKKKRNPVEDFSANIQSSLLSRISREIADTMLGENAKDSGSFLVGGTNVDFHRDGENIVVNISEEGAGSTTIEMPFPNY